MVDIAKFKPNTVFISGLKSMIETGKPLRMDMEGPPPGMIKAVQRAIAEKPWERR